MFFCPIKKNKIDLFFLGGNPHWVSQHLPPWSWVSIHPIHPPGRFCGRWHRLPGCVELSPRRQTLGSLDRRTDQLLTSEDYGSTEGKHRETSDRMLHIWYLYVYIYIYICICVCIIYNTYFWVNDITTSLRPKYLESWLIEELIPFYGRTIQVCELL